MAIKSTETQWGGMAKLLHWLMALAIIGNGIFGLIMVEMPRGMGKLNAFALHKSIGLTVLALLLLRVSWRWFDRKPRDEPMPRWQSLAAIRYPAARRNSDDWQYRSGHRASTSAATARCVAALFLPDCRRGARSPAKLPFAS